MKIKKILINLFGGLIFSIISFILIILVYFEYKEIPIYNFRLAYKFIKGEQNYTQFKNLAEKLGYNKDDKLLIIHADDLGLSNSVNNASFKALNEGNINSASVMMTCDKIDEVAEFSKKNPEIDLGIHLTVTSEWEFHKWDGVLDSKEIQSLINKNGNLYENKKGFTVNANVNELKKELQAQIDLAKSLGINFSHIDSHEGALFYKSEFFKAYLDLAKENKLAVFVPDIVTVQFDKDLIPPSNLVVVDDFYMAENGMDLNNWEEFYIGILNNLKPGLSQIIVHLGYDDKEMRKITIDHPNFGSKWRKYDYDIVSNKKFSQALINNNIKLVNWREIQKVMYPN